MSSEPSSRPSRGRRRRFLAGVRVLAAGILVAGGLLLAFAGTDGRQEEPLSSGAATPARLVPRDFVRTVRVTGRTEATRSRVILAPQLMGATGGMMVVTKIAPPGTLVKTGDIVVEFDRQAQDTPARVGNSPQASEPYMK